MTQENENKEGTTEATTEATITPAADPAPTPDPTPAATPSDPVTAKLIEMGVTPDVIDKIKTNLGPTSVEDLTLLTEADLVECGMPKLPARRLAATLAPKPEATATSTTAGNTMATPQPRVTAASTIRLGDPPAEATNWLTSLSAIKPQIIQKLTVITGIKASMADVYGFFQLPKKMMSMLREAADDVGEGVPELYFDLQRLTQARRYGVLISWMQNKGSACTVAERNRFLTRMHGQFWDALDTFYLELDAWRKGRRDSVDIGEAMANAFAGEGQIYDATTVRTAGLALGDSINHVFAGTGVYAATALALDNAKLQEVLLQMDFRQFGVTSREMLLQRLECAVPPEMVAAESTISKFVWNVMSLGDMAAGGMDEQKFLIELASIGSARQWNAIKLLGAKRKYIQPSDVKEDPEEEDEDGDGPPEVTGITGRKNKL